jgi:hypothetical protein
MPGDDSAARRPAAASELGEHENRRDGPRIAESIDCGLALLAHTLYIRLHEDVEQLVGTDSMLMPVAPEKTRIRTIREIGLYHVAESALLVRQAGYLRDGGDWYVHWLGRLRLGEFAPDGSDTARIAHYIADPPDRRRLRFTDILSQVLPESRRAPLVLFRLVPLAVQVATALAFGDTAGAGQARSEQAEQLPAMADCRHCKGRVLENGEQCTHCGNPLWKSQWLTAAD